MTLAVNAHTDEQRALIESGAIAPGAKELDVPVSSMTDREIAEEMLIHMRNTRDGLGQLAEMLSDNPLVKMMGGNLGRLFG